MSKITWYSKPERYTVTMVPRSTLSYEAALARIAELEATAGKSGHEPIEQTRDQAKDPLLAVDTSAASPAPAKKPDVRKSRAPRKPRAPIDNSVTAIVLRSKITKDGEVKQYVRNARKTSGTWYPVWSYARSSAVTFSHSDALDLVSWLKKSLTVDRSYIYWLEKTDA